MTVAARAATLVVADGLSPRFPTGDAGAYSLTFQCFPEPVGVITTVRDHPHGSRQTAQQGGGSGIITDLACRHEELQGPSLGVGGGTVHFCTL